MHRLVHDLDTRRAELLRRFTPRRMVIRDEIDELRANAKVEIEAFENGDLMYEVLVFDAR